MSQISYILCIPEIALEKIFSFLTYDEIAKNRIVCKTFNDVGSKLLSRSFYQLEKRHAAIHKRFKSLLPRRESERKSHPLSRHCDILQAVETRLSMLSMTYKKYIESNMLCFIPGKVLDEIKGLLKLVETNQNPPRTHQLLQELRDLSSMAMEHFDEHILPRLQEQVDLRSGDISYSTAASGSKTSRFIFAHNSLSNEIRKVKKQSKSHKYHISYLAQSTQKLTQKLKKQNKHMKTQFLKIQEQANKIQEQNTKIREQEAALAEMKKHIEEWDQKHKDLHTELVRAKEDFMSIGAREKTPIVQQKLYKPHRTPVLSTYLDLERKRKGTTSNDVPVKQIKTDDKDVRFKNEISDDDDCGSKFTRSKFGQIVASLLLSQPINSKNRKRKMQEDLDL
ncbi:F-box only protein 28 [Diorhabda sublineata]|uniref:F-box only protein 28 n=1 Tax=Diorhabda sublineata TaxID=1163346 RepID=UPI0024E0E40C|nr:F-box only protein 28 [Diorhabda sublineata]